MQTEYAAFASAPFHSPGFPEEEVQIAFNDALMLLANHFVDPQTAAPQLPLPESIKVRIEHSSDGYTQVVLVLARESRQSNEIIFIRS